MPMYLVKVRQEREWEGVIEAPSADAAQDIARMEIRGGEIQDEQFIVEEVVQTTMEVD